MTLSYLQGHLPTASPYKWDFADAAVDKISTARRAVSLRQQSFMLVFAFFDPIKMTVHLTGEIAPMLHQPLLKTRHAWQSLACSPRGIAVTPLANNWYKTE